MAAHIKGHNNALLKPKEQNLPCNCRVNVECPLNGECRTTSVGYEATVTIANTTKEYISLTAIQFQTRHEVHKTSMRHERYAATELAKYVWKLSEKNMHELQHYVVDSGACRIVFKHK